MISHQGIPPVDYDHLKELQDAGRLLQLPYDACLPQHLRGTILTPQNFRNTHFFFTTKLFYTENLLRNSYKPTSHQITRGYIYRCSLLTKLEIDIMNYTDILISLAQAVELVREPD